MQRDYWYTAGRGASDLRPAAEVGRIAGERTVRRLGARKLGTLECPVLFEAPEAADLIGSFVGAVSGGALYRKSSFLLDCLGKAVFSPNVSIREDPHIPRARGSAPFDNEGVATAPRDVVRDGVVQGYFLGSYSARKLGMVTTGNAGGSHNLVVAHGEDDLAALMRRMGRGLFVTEQLGQGVNPVTGDYSRGAAGFWIEDGAIAYPVEEITIAGNLKDIYRDIVAIGRDVDRRGSRHTGSILVGRMTVAGHLGAVRRTRSPTPMLEPAFTWIRSLKDPFRNPNAAAQWIAGLPATDAMALQKEALELVANFPGSRRIIGPAQAEALLRIDARLEPVLAQLAQQYATNYQKSTEVETRLWHAVFDLVKAFAAAYSAVLRTGYPRAAHKRWQALLPWILVRLVHYRGLDGKFRLFRYGTWIPAQWREFHELYEFARARGWQRNELAYGAGMFSRPGVCVEQEYLKTLLLMRLDSGNFTPDQVEWVARQLEGWAASLMLVPPPGAGASFFIDLTGSQGLRRQDKALSGDRMLLLDAGPIYTQIVERMRWLPERDDDAPRQDDPPPREQRLLLMRLASLYGPDAIAQSPRATRFTTNADVRVVVGLAPLTRAIAEIDRLPDNARTPGVAASYDEVTDMVNPAHGPGNGDAPGPRQSVADGGSQRHRLPAHGARQGSPVEARARSSH